MWWYRFVGDGELAEIMSNHLRFNFHLCMLLNWENRISNKTDLRKKETKTSQPPSPVWKPSRCRRRWWSRPSRGGRSCSAGESSPRQASRSPAWKMITTLRKQFLIFVWFMLWNLAKHRCTEGKPFYQHLLTLRQDPRAMFALNQQFCSSLNTFAQLNTPS